MPLPEPDDPAPPPASPPVGSPPEADLAWYREQLAEAKAIVEVQYIRLEQYAGRRAEMYEQGKSQKALDALDEREGRAERALALYERRVADLERTLGDLSVPAADPRENAAD